MFVVVWQISGIRFIIWKDPSKNSKYMDWSKPQKLKPLNFELELTQSQFRVAAWALVMITILLVAIASLLGRLGVGGNWRDHSLIVVLTMVSVTSLATLWLYQRGNERHLKWGHAPDLKPRRWAGLFLVGVLIGVPVGALLAGAAFVAGDFVYLSRL